MTWQPGQSGNPKGKPKGARHAAHVALDAIGTEAASDVLATVIEAARDGDLRAAEILLSRCWPAPKGRTVTIDLPTIRTAADIPLALARITEAVAAGELTTDEGETLARLVTSHRAAFELAELEARITALEARDGAELP